LRAIERHSTHASITQTDTANILQIVKLSLRMATRGKLCHASTIDVADNNKTITLQGLPLK